MAKHSDVIAAVAEYEQRYRPPLLPRFEVTGLYDLFPKPEDSPVSTAEHWPNPWLLGHRQGVYVILDKQPGVLYVGKASMGNCISFRLASYFGYEPDQSCRVYQRWSSDPRYILSIAVPIGSPFEAPALEEFLIDRFSPPDNRRGVRHVCDSA